MTSFDYAFIGGSYLENTRSAFLPTSETYWSYAKRMAKGDLMLLFQGMSIAATLVVFAQGSLAFAQLEGPDGSPFAIGANVAFGVAAGTAIGTAAAVVFRAIGESIWKPWLETQSNRVENTRLVENLAILHKEVVVLEQQLQDSQVKLSEMDQLLHKRQEESSTRILELIGTVTELVKAAQIRAVVTEPIIETETLPN